MMYAEQEIEEALRMKNSSRKISFKYDLLNINDIKIGELDGVKGKVSYGEFRQIKRTATFNLDEYQQKEINYLQDQIQPWFILHMPDGGIVQWSLGVFLLSSPTRGVSRREIVAYDKTLILDEARLTERYFIPKNTEYIGAIIKLLSMTGITKFEIKESDSLTKADREFPIGEKVKDVINQLLTEINYDSIRANELGYITTEPYVLPALRPITQIYKADRESIILPSYSQSLDLAGRPNVFTRVAINLEEKIEFMSTYKNMDILSPISILNRGREIVDFEEIESISSQETLDNLVRRIAIENSQTYTHLNFSTALMPTHGSADTLYLDIPDLFDVPAKFSETAWEMDLKFDGLMTHEARKVVDLNDTHQR